MKKILITTFVILLLFLSMTAIFIIALSNSYTFDNNIDKHVSYYGLINPLNSFNITSYYGESRDNDLFDTHKGTDFSCNENEPIYSVSDGIVKTIYTDEYGANILEIRSSISSNENIIVLYAHQNENLVKEGQYIKQNEVIALCGSTGFSTGNHLHLEIKINGGNVNPELMLPIDNYE